MKPTPQFSVAIHPKAIDVCSVLQNAGHQAHIVGGCVRDLHLGLTPKDWDICTDASPEEVVKLFQKTIPTGLKHGTITVCMGEGVENHFEVTTFRVEGEYLDGRRPEEVKFVKSVTEDLARRDLTINAMAYDPIAQMMVDPFGGKQDLDAGIIRAVGNASDRFQEDGLRIMRVARFAARFGYRIEGNTFIGMKSNLETLKKVSKERISDELSKIVMSKYRSHGMMLLLETDALEIVCPLLKNASVTGLKKLDQCDGDLETRLAVLYHKHPSKSVEEELIALKLSGKEIKRTLFLLQTLQAFVNFQKQDNTLAYRQFIANIINLSPDTLEYTLAEFIILASALDLTAWEVVSRYKDEIIFGRSEMQINGNDLMALGIKPGPIMKAYLDKCYAEILREPEHNKREFLLNYVLR